MIPVRVVSEEIVKPSHPTPHHLRYHQLSLFDLINSPFLAPTIYFFCCPKNTTPHERAIFLSKLKNSFATALSIFYPLAGRLENSNYITCNDMGVPYMLAKASVTLENVVFKAEVSDLDMLVPFVKGQGYSQLPLAIQINIFECGGVAIGIKSNHRITDGFSTVIFLHAWADITYGKDPNQVTHPNFNASKLFSPVDNHVDVFEDPNPDFLTHRPLAKWFMFKREKLDTLRSKLCSLEQFNSFPSIGMVLSAFIWSRIIILSRDNNKNISNEVFVTVDLRLQVINSTESTFYFGNMIVNAIAIPQIAVKDGDNGDSICLTFLEKTRASMKNLLNNNDFIKALQDGKQDLRFVTDQFERLIKGKSRVMGFSGIVTGLDDIGGFDFGWGKPVWSMTGTMIKDLVLFNRAGPDSRDIIATINLSSEDMIKLEADEVFNSFVFKRATNITSKL